MDHSSFKDLRENGAIIDKSEFIYEFIGNPGSFIAAFFQRRFGKSTNLYMVKTFVELEFDEISGVDRWYTSNKEIKTYEELLGRYRKLGKFKKLSEGHQYPK